MLLIWGYIFHNWELQGMWSWTPAFMAACLGAAGAVGTKAAGLGANIVALFHVMGLVASLSMGILSDRFGRARVMVMLAAVSMICSFTFGWTIGLSLSVIIGIGMIYAFSSLGDSPILSVALTEEMEPSYLGSALGLRSFLGFGGAAIAPLAFGAVLDLKQSPRQRAETLRHLGLGLQLTGSGRTWGGLDYLPIRRFSGRPFRIAVIATAPESNTVLFHPGHDKKQIYGR